MAKEVTMEVRKLVTTEGWYRTTVKFYDCDNKKDNEVVILGVNDLIICHVDISGQSLDRVIVVEQKDGQSADESLLRMFIAVEKVLGERIKCYGGMMQPHCFRCIGYKPDVRINGMDAMNYFEYILETVGVE